MPRTQRAAGESGGKDWRSKYRAGAADGGREATCLELAELWKLCLTKANESIVRNGGTPMVPDDVIAGRLGNCIVLAVDRILPADLEVTPELQVSVASTVVTGQAWWWSRKAKASGAARSTSAKQGAQYVNPDPPPPTQDPAPDKSPPKMSIVRGGPVKIDDDTVF